MNQRFIAIVTGTIFGVALGVPLGLGIIWAVGETVEHFTKPTADESYGCTVAQQAPNGDCP